MERILVENDKIKLLTETIKSSDFKSLRLSMTDLTISVNTDVKVSRNLALHNVFTKFSEIENLFFKSDIDSLKDFVSIFNNFLFGISKNPNYVNDSNLLSIYWAANFYFRVVIPFRKVRGNYVNLVLKLKGREDVSIDDFTRVIDEFYDFYFGKAGLKDFVKDFGDINTSLESEINVSIKHNIESIDSFLIYFVNDIIDLVLAIYVKGIDVKSFIKSVSRFNKDPFKGRFHESSLGALIKLIK